VLTKVTAYSQWDGIDPLIFNVINRPETDLFEVRNFDGLGAVKANVNTTPMGSVKGSGFTGTSVGERNLVLTLGLDPDWDEWTVSRLRRLLDKYFMPEQEIRFVFESMEFSPVEISGYIESNDPNIFSKDPEQQISVICPSPDFVSVDPVVVNGTTDMVPISIDYEGNVKTGIVLAVTHNSGAATSIVTVQPGEMGSRPFVVSNAVVDAGHRFMLDSIPGEKFVRTYTVPGNVQTNLLDDINVGSIWPELFPGEQDFVVQSDAGIKNWTLTYYNRFGSL